jgi:phosphoribulokinase
MSDAPASGAPTHFPFILGIIGDSGSGKSTIADGVRALIGQDRVTSLELDDYHRYTRAERLDLGLTALNPTVHNLPLMQEHLQLLRRGRPVRNRRYDHSDGTFGPIRTLEPNEVVIARGLLGFPTEDLRAAYDLAVFLQPEPELLFRWKLRRDVKTRGYSEAEVLKRIAQHLLDSKQYVLPQADRADLVVRYRIPEWDAPDSDVSVDLVLRRAAAEAVRSNGVLPRFAGDLRVEHGEGEAADELTLQVTPSLSAEKVDEWARDLFADTHQPGSLGAYMDEDGSIRPSGPIGFTQVLIAELTQKLRRRADTARSATAEGARVAV